MQRRANKQAVSAAAIELSRNREVLVVVDVFFLQFQAPDRMASTHLVAFFLHNIKRLPTMPMMAIVMKA